MKTYKKFKIFLKIMNLKVENKFMIFFVTIGKIEDAENLAYKLVEQKIAACCNIIENITSIYFWNNKIEKEKEYLIIIKTMQEKKNELIEFIKKNHPYQVPECIGFNIEQGNNNYLNWILETLNRK